MLSINTCKVFCRGGVAAAFASSMAIRPSHSSPLVVTPLLALSDNYIYLLHNTQTGETAVVDPSTSDAVIAFLAGEKLELQTILVTHKHCTIYQPTKQVARPGGPSSSIMRV